MTGVQQYAFNWNSSRLAELTANLVRERLIQVNNISSDDYY
jgi:hypothetical protein